MRAAQAKWGRLSEHDLSGIRNKQDLIICVQERYSLPHWRAIQDVEHWANAVRPTLGKGHEAPFAPIARLRRGLGARLEKGCATYHPGT